MSSQPLPAQSKAATPGPQEGDDSAASTRRPWQVLVVDDDEEVLTVSRIMLRDLRFEGRGIDLLMARSANEARALLVAHPDIALILLDMVMETELAGLDVVAQVRDDLQNRAVRIVLVTGQPGQLPPLQVVERYEIDDYCGKTELTQQRLRVITIAALRTYRRLRELLDVNRELEQFAYAASHDLQTPLRGITGLSQVLRRRLADADPGIRELADQIVASGRDLHEMIDSLLVYSRIGREPRVEVPVELDRVVQRCRERLRPLIEERGAVLEVAPLPTVDGSAVQLEQLFANLIENAIKYQPGPAPQVDIRCQRLEHACEIRVSDRGIGIEPEHLERVFEPFRRLHTSDAIAGTGVGLPICRKVAQLHGGSLHAESKPGAGTTMVLRLPLPQRTQPTPASPRLQLR